MIINLIIKHSKITDTNYPVYRAIVKKIKTTNTFVDRTICSCGHTYPKVLEIEQLEFVVPIEVNYKEDFEVVIEAKSPEELVENLVAYLQSKLSCSKDIIQHGGEETVLRVYGGQRSCLYKEQEGPHD